MSILEIQLYIHKVKARDAELGNKLLNLTPKEFVDMYNKIRDELFDDELKAFVESFKKS